VYILDYIDRMLNPNTPYRPLAANREPIKLDGQAMVTITVADINETILVQVQPDCTAELILGNNFLGRFKSINFNYKKSTVRFLRQNVTAVEMPYFPPSSRGQLVLRESLSIPSRSALRLQVLCSKPIQVS